MCNMRKYPHLGVSFYTILVPQQKNKQKTAFKKPTSVAGVVFALPFPKLSVDSKAPL